MNQQTYDGITPLLMAVYKDRHAIVGLLLERGADAPDREHRTTPLHMAAIKGDREMVAMLLKYGAEKRVKMKSGEKPVDIARQQCHTALIPLLEP